MCLVLIITIIVVIYLCFNSRQDIKSSLSFSNACDSKEEYEKRKAKKIELATGGFYFWDKLEIPTLESNIECLKNWICPYCNEKLIERKGRTFKCPHCKEKIFKKRELATKKEGLFTEQQKQEIDLLWDEYHKRIRFLEKYQYIDKIIIPEPTLTTLGNNAKSKYTDDKKKNMQTLISYLHLGLPIYYKKEQVHKLRECRFFEGEFQKDYGTQEQATNAFMSVLYLDLIGDYNTLFSDSDFTKKELKEMGCKEWNHGSIAPGIYERAFKEDLSLEKFEEIFIFNANSLLKTLQFKPPITPKEAWVKILEYRKENNIE